MLTISKDTRVFIPVTFKIENDESIEFKYYEPTTGQIDRGFEAKTQKESYDVELEILKENLEGDRKEEVLSYLRNVTNLYDVAQELNKALQKEKVKKYKTSS